VKNGGLRIKGTRQKDATIKKQVFTHPEQVLTHAEKKTNNPNKKDKPFLFI